MTYAVFSIFTSLLETRKGVHAPPRCHTRQPARETGTLNYQRCALLHNFLVEYSWLADGHPLADLERRSFFERYGDKAEEIRERLDPALIAFLEAAYDVRPQQWPNPIEDHPELWHPLETVLGNWIHMIQLGKITATPEETDCEKQGLWAWHSYGEAQIDNTVAAFDRLVEAIESLFTTVDTSSDDDYDDKVIVPPVLLFRATNLTANFDWEDKYRSLNPYRVAKGDHCVPVGLYSESVPRSVIDYAEEGFRLILPFSLWGGERGVRKSKGQDIEKGSVADLFQHGFKPFGGDWWRAQRLERLFGKWTELVERGVWDVDRRGVAGTILKFDDANKGAWRDYFIEPVLIIRIMMIKPLLNKAVI
ncbi:hypothetical protein GMDG_07058 [Pseudogymnoascus destructans 20631-21]|uniref:Uncharacterized protein n=1 Tax=Pseudogymnoascus destructans (strain ATCC MYA-4855 / 20631-21) TaxID=658429 RepID=L8FWH1_PSED2|nr:hypothetical protein GMDG_07058 [Pseudogymnoascus destructans 20631-21]